MTEADVERLLQDAGIIRHRGKIASTINNAKRDARDPEGVRQPRRLHLALRARAAQRRPTLARQHPVRDRSLARAEQGPAQTRLQLRRPHHLYAFMQAMGLVNDHYTPLLLPRRMRAERKKLKRPHEPAAGSRRTSPACGGGATSSDSLVEGGGHDSMSP